MASLLNMSGGSLLNKINRTHKTVALLHFTDEENPLKDDCGNIWIANGSYSIETNSSITLIPQKGILLQNQTISLNGYINIPNEELTIEVFVKDNGTSSFYSYSTYIGMTVRGYSGRPYWISLRPNNFDYLGSTSATSAYPSTNNTYSHIAVTCSKVGQEYKWRRYVNGRLSLEKNGNSPQNLYTVTVGSRGGDNVNNLNALLTELRISNVCRYDANFIPPTQRFEVD